MYSGVAPTGTLLSYTTKPTWSKVSCPQPVLFTCHAEGRLMSEACHTPEGCSMVGRWVQSFAEAEELLLLHVNVQ